MITFDEPETVINEAYNATFCGLRNTRVFNIRNETKYKLLGYLNANGVRSISMDSENGMRISVLKTGIKTDRSFDKNQI